MRDCVEGSVDVPNVTSCYARYFPRINLADFPVSAQFYLHIEEQDILNDLYSLFCLIPSFNRGIHCSPSFTIIIFINTLCTFY